MPRQGIENLEDSLFSLELVVEKLYIPHTPCRFPAIAFRLLDYPTIVIKHVDDELGKAIRRKISFDPSYNLPDQFIELKDRHGNYMINKGKSCLLRIPADILKQHLANTPLYVMVIDLFPEVPKLVGNSSVPLNTLMDLICIDIAKVGPTVPSVHGDKGLFKLYNLMGNEIGYFVLGFRLLCLGPSLIPHLPESILLHQQSKSRQTRKNQSSHEVIRNHLGESQEVADEFEVEVRNSACMTDPEKHDVLLQTVEMHDKAINAGLLDSGIQTEFDVVAKKESHSLSTQTEKRTQTKEALNAQQKWLNVTKPDADEYEDVIINNIVCPPPLFYNSNASPNIKIDTEKAHYEELTDDLSDIHSYDGQGLDQVKTRAEGNIQQDYQMQVRSFVSPKIPVPQARLGETVKGLQVAPNPSSVFPLLTALLNELSCIQSPQLLLNVSNQIQAVSQNMQRSDQPPDKIEQIHQIQKNDKLSPSAVHAVAAALAKKIENSTENKNMARSEKPSKPQNSQSSVNIIKQEIQQGQKQTSVLPAKKSKLVYGITHTQRLRLQKTNPQWLKTAERKMPNLKTKTQPLKKEIEADELSAALFSDTLTEVRRLAEKELNNTASEDNLLNLTRAVEFSSGLSAKHNEITIPEVKDRNTIFSTKKSKQIEKNKRSAGVTSNMNKISLLKGRQKPTRSKTSQQNEALKGKPDSSEVSRIKPVPQVRQFRDFTSPPYDDQEMNAEDQASPDQGNSINHSVEISFPSPDDSNESIPLPDDSLVDKGESLSINFPKYLSKDVSLPESINGTANASLNMSEELDDQSPLESTRQSKNMVSDQNDSKVLQSTDYDTRQFQSTDEPELQDLLSEEENPSNGAVSRNDIPARGTNPFPVINPQMSENSPVPSVRRSTNKQDLAMHSYIPSFSQKLESSSSSRSMANKSNRHAADDDNDDDFKAQYNPKEKLFQQIGPNIKKFPIERNDTPSSTASSPQRPTPQPRKPTPRSLHTDSLSSYMPSDPDNVVISLSSYSGNYSDDFLQYDVDGSKQSTSSVEQLQKIIPNAKLGYTIH